MSCRGKIARDILVTCSALTRTDICRAGNARRRQDRPGGGVGAAGKQDDRKGGDSSRAPENSFSILAEPVDEL